MQLHVGTKLPVAQFADIVRDRLQTRFTVPNATRWNSYFYAVDKIRQVIDKHSEDNIAQVFQAPEVPIFRPNEMAYCLMSIAV
jgi:hypothetical protein